MSEVVSRDKINWLYVVVAYLSLGARGFLDTMRGPYFPDITQDLRLGDTEASLFFVVTSFIAALSGRVTVWGVSRMGLLNVMRLGHVFMACGSLYISQSMGILTLIWGCIIFGVGYGFINVGQNVLILKGATPHRRRQLFSGLHSIYALAAILAPVAVSVMYEFDFNWRMGFRWATLFCLVAFLSTFFGRDKYKAESLASSAPPVPLRQALPLTAQLSFYILAEVLIGTRLVLFLRREYLVSPELAAQLLALFFGLLLTGRILFSALPLRRVSSEKVILYSLIASLIVNIVGLVMSPYILVLCGLTMAPIFGVGMDLISERFHDRADQALATCLAWSAVFIVAMHFIVGLITQTAGVSFAMWLGPCFLVLSIVILQRLMPTVEKK